jgi:hypothetical protein
MNYAVRVVGSDELPEGVERVLVERMDGTPLLLLAPSAAGTWTMIQAWEAEQRQPAEVFELRAV